MMDSSQNKKNSSKHRKTNTQRQRKSSDAHNIITEQKSELTAQQQNMAQVESKNAEVENLQLKTDKKRTDFRIQITPSDGNYCVAITHPLAEDQRIFGKMDKDGILDFIYGHLSFLDDSIKETEIQNQTSDTKAKEEISEIKIAPLRAPRTSAKAVKKVIQDVRIKQSNHFLEEGDFICSQRPLTLYTRLHLPVTPSTENIDIEMPAYGIRVIVKDVNLEKPIIADDVADNLTLGVTDYESTFSIPGLNPGKYSINIYAVVPFAHIKEQKSIAIDVN